ncbi:MAG: MFS transporter [Candidatus Omnitrophica bacterium]|nr:MFS transporter [Candidatus Omnitrophota bacterium]MDD5671942.1 MFS transporter [Candidatus Omnitrophota bacterium]
MTDRQIKIYKDRNLQIIFTVTLMNVLGVSSIAPALPNVQQALNVSSQNIGLLISVFTLPGVLLTFVFGVLADRFGRKEVILPSLVLFAVAGCACAWARDFNILLVLRFIQGVGAAALGALNITMIGDLYRDQDLARAMGYNAAVLSVGTCLYPAVGGALALWGWYYPFLLSFLALPVAGGVLFFLKTPRPEANQHLSDYLKNVWGIVKAPKVFLLFIVSLVTFIVIYGGCVTYFPIFMQQVFLASPLTIGLFLSVMSLGTMIGSWQLGKLTDRLTEKAVVAVGFLIYILVSIVIPRVSNLWFLLIPAFLFGFAHGINVPAVQVLLVRQTPADYRGAVMSSNGMILRLGQTLGPVMLGWVLIVGGIPGTFYACAFLSLVMWILLKTVIGR